MRPECSLAYSGIPANYYVFLFAREYTMIGKILDAKVFLKRTSHASDTSAYRCVFCLLKGF